MKNAKQKALTSPERSFYFDELNADEPGGKGNLELITEEMVVDLEHQMRRQQRFFHHFYLQISKQQSEYTVKVGKF